MSVMHTKHGHISHGDLLQVVAVFKDMAGRQRASDFDIAILTQQEEQRLRREIPATPKGDIARAEWPTSIYGLPYETYPTMNEAAVRVRELQSQGKKVWFGYP